MLKKYKNKIINLIKEHREILIYVIVGGMTTLVSWATHISLFKFAGMNDNVSNIISIIVAVTFAFFANKIFVFRSKTETKTALFREMVLFGASRLVSAIVEVFGYIFMKFLIGYVNISLIKENPEIAAKILIGVVIIILNYVLSKFIVFRKKKEN
ncbi:MAG: GtrA family protein [Ruminococcus sp.]|jgi:putative flippase GtrA|nr:GtrA family protein [Ruminococcus sp.]